MDIPFDNRYVRLGKSFYVETPPESVARPGLIKFNHELAQTLITTGEEVARERLLPGGVITRVASSFVRVGTFQYFSARGDLDAVRALADHVIENNYPQSRTADNPYVALFEAVVDRQAALIARWMQLGFIHGVMNTDNMSIAGETIDYGPCAFMDGYAHDQVYSFIDRQGRYAYNRQPSIGLWNLTRLAESISPLLSDEPDPEARIAREILGTWPAVYEKYWLAGMRAKCGLTEAPLASISTDDKVLIEDLFDTMAENSADFTLTFYGLSRLPAQPSEQDNELRELFDDPAQFDTWLERWRKRLQHEEQGDAQRQTSMQAVNPVYIPRNHQVEAAIRAAEDHEDFSVFHALHDVLQKPYERQTGKEIYRLPPEPGEVVSQTFCGT